jgi:two-component system NarL family sensor kinase
MHALRVCRDDSHTAAFHADVSLHVEDRARAVGARRRRVRRRLDPGVGITSIRERSLEVGGTLAAYAPSDGGLVEATIPRWPSG